MAEARGRDEWSRAAAGMAHLANIHRDPKKHRPFVPDDFNPYAESEERDLVIKHCDVSVLKTIFVDQKGGQK